MQGRHFPWAVALVLAAAMSLADAHAQDQSTGSMWGYVSDETGGRLPGVTINAESESHIGVETTFSDDQGFYRFDRLLPGLFTIRAELAGFATAERREIRVDVGMNYRLDLTLPLVTVTETVTVIGQAPTIDPKTSTVRTNYPNDFLQSIPQPRGGTGAAILRIAPGVDANSSVGGSAEDSAVAWMLDGVDVSDPASGAQFPFYNYDYIEEGEIVTYGAPAEYGKFGGAVFNVVTKSGGTEFHGAANLYYTGGDLVSENVDDINARYADNAFFTPLASDQIEQRYDATFNIGGPIEKNVLHFFGSFQQVFDDTIPAGRTSEQQDRSSRLLGKLTWQASPRHRLSGFIEHDRSPVDGIQPEFLASPDPNNAVDQESPNTTPRLHWQFTPNASNILDVQYSGFYGYFDLTPRNTLPPVIDIGTNEAYQSWVTSKSNRERTEIRSDVTHYADDFLGQHEFKIGVGYELGIADSLTSFGTNDYGQNLVYYAYFGYVVGGGTFEGETRTETENRVLTFYARDSWTLGERLTLNLGIRYDRGVGHFPQVDQDAFTFDDLSPRLFATYDLTGDGKTVARGGFGRYYEKIFGDTYSILDPGSSPFQFFLFNSGPGGCGRTVEGFPSVGGGPECFFGLGAGNVDVVFLFDPLATTGIDSGLENHYIDQFHIGFERELFSDFSVGATYIHKREQNLFAGLETQAQYEPTTIVDPLTGDDVPAFLRVTPPEEVFTLLTNRNDVFERRYDGFELRWQKRFRSGWQLLGAWTLQKAEGNHDNFSDSAHRLDGANPNELVNAEGELLNSRRNVFKLQGSYRIPRADVLLGWLISSQSGRTYNRIIQEFLPDLVGILAEPRGSRRLERLDTVDLRFEKRFRFGDRNELGVLVDFFNIFNDSAVEAVNETTGDAFELPLAVSSPRVVQFGVRWEF